MKNKKFHKKELKPNSEETSRDGISKRKTSSEKVKYRHKNFWIDEEDVDFELSKHRLDAEEE